MIERAVRRYADHYEYDGYAYMFSYMNEYRAYGHAWTGTYYESSTENRWSDPYPFDVGGYLYNPDPSMNAQGRRLIGYESNFGFRSIRNVWSNDSEYKGLHDNHGYSPNTHVDYERLFKTTYKRTKTYPQHNGIEINGGQYQVGNDYWVRPNTQLNIKVGGYQNYPGDGGLVLDDYINRNYLRLDGGSGNDARICYNFSVGAQDNFQPNDGVTMSYVPNSAWTSSNGKTKTASFYATPKKDAVDYRVKTYFSSANGKTTDDYYDTGNYIKVDGKAPTLDSIEYPKVAVDNIDIRALGVRDIRGNNSDGVGVEKIEFRVFPKKDPSKAKVYLAIKNSDGSYSVGIDLKNDFPNIYGEYTIETIGTDLVGNTGVIDSVGTGSFTRGQPDLTITQFNVVDSNGKVVSNLIKGDEYILSVTVKNQGILNATSSNISLSSNNKVFANLSLESLQPNQESTKVYKFIPNLTGKYEVTAFADSNNEIVESNENNNKKITSYEVFYKNNKPKALFTVTPTLQDRNKTLIYTDKSTPGDEWDEIVQREWKWTRVEDENGKAVNEASKTGSTPPSSFSIYGKYKIELRVKDKGNIASPGLWSDWYTQYVTILESDLTIESINIIDKDGNDIGTNLVQNENYRAKIVISNIGRKDSIPCVLELNNMGSIEKVNVPVIKKGEKAIFYIPISQINNLGKKQLIGFVDSNNIVQEENENNNKFNISYEVFYKNNKPKALFTVTPTLQDRNKTLIYTDKSTPGDEWDEIVQREWKWTRVEDENGKAVNEASKTGSTPPSSFSIYGKYKIELRVKDKGNIASPGLWSDWYTQYVTILESDLTIESINIIDKDGNDIGTNLVQNENYRAKIVISNIGRKDSIPCVLELTSIVENKDKLIKELPIPSIQKNKSVTVFIPLNNIDTIGAKEIRGFIDSTNLAQEENEDNNKYSKYITVYPKNNKPKAVFDVTPKVEDRNRLLTYSTEGTYDPDEWDEIVQWEWKWTRIKDEKGNAVSETVYTGAIPPSSFNTYGVYEIMLRVRDKGNVASPSLWSDWSEPKQVTIKNLITVNATISPNPSKQGQLVKIIMNTTYSPNKLIIDFPTDLVNVSKNNIKIDLNDDGIVDQKDLDLIKGFYNYRPSTPGWDSKYDLNDDGVIDIYDIVLIAANQGKEISTLDKLEPQVILDIPVMDDKVTTEYEFFLPLNTELTYDRKGKKLREPYVFTITALRELDGEREECKVELDVVGSIYDGIRTRMK